MNGSMILFLKALVFVAIVVVLYFVWKTVQRKKWNDLLLEKQKRNGIVELFKVKYRYYYLAIIIFFLIFFTTLNDPITVSNTISNVNVTEIFTKSTNDPLEDMIASINPQDGDVYIVQMKRLEERNEFNLLTSTVTDDLKDYYTYDVNVVAEVYATTTAMFTASNSKVIISDTISVTYMSSTNSDNLSIESTNSAETVLRDEVYLIIGGYITVDEAAGFDDSRLYGGNYIYSNYTILLPDYDVNKPPNEQSELIKSIIEEYTKDLPD